MKKSFQTHIIDRFMSPDKLNEFLEVYNSSRIKSGREKRGVCQRDFEIYYKRKDGALITALAIEYGRSWGWVWKSIKLAAKALHDNSL